MDVGEALANESGGLVGDVQVYAVLTKPLGFMVDGPGDDIPGSEFAAAVEAGHEALAVCKFEPGAFTAHGLGDKEAAGVWMEQACGMELVELHVGDAAARAPGHGNAVAAGAVGVGGVEIGLAGAAGGEHDEFCLDGENPAAGVIEHESASAAPPGASVGARVAGDEVDGGPAFHQLNIGMFAGAPAQGLEYGLARGVGGVDDAPVAMGAFLGEMQ